MTPLLASRPVAHRCDDERDRIAELLAHHVVGHPDDPPPEPPELTFLARAVVFGGSDGLERVAQRGGPPAQRSRAEAIVSMARNIGSGSP